MAIRQQKRPDAPHPEVRETEYGATFVKAGTETSASETVTTDEAPEPTAVVSDEPAEKPRKKGGRPKKAAK